MAATLFHLDGNLRALQEKEVDQSEAKCHAEELNEVLMKHVEDLEERLRGTNVMLATLGITLG